LYDEYGEPQSPYINIADEDPREDPGKQSRVSRDSIPLFFLSYPMEDGQRHGARIVGAIEDHDGEIEDNPTRIKFLCSINDDESEDIITYN
jgi:hypothetical protein